MASAIDSLMDLAATAVNLVSLREAQRPPDPEHPYGRGKSEALAGLLQGALIGLSGLALLLESGRRVLRGAEVSPGAFALASMAFCAAASLWHGRRLKRASDGSHSTVLRTEGAHFLVDFLSNLGVLLALLAVRWSGRSLWDLGISSLITLLVLREAARVLGLSARELLDRRLPEPILREIQATILGHHPRVTGFHDLRTRKAGSRLFIDFHIEIRDVKDFEEAHEITESLIDRLRGKFPGADVTVHYDPLGGR